MKLSSSRKGSALLIVLGMLSFMVISAVGFAIYMRQSRLPSSYLRRAASSRYLLKAALANAIDRIDGAYSSVSGGRCEGIYDDPYPGVGSSGEAISNNGNYWVKRIFTPFGQVDTASTVSTLTLEGLAYLPPAIINEVRVYSRRTRTAQWRNLAYDAGRYAFCAVDVSDCFDINKLSAGNRRTSAAGERINLSSLFPSNGAQLDTVLDKCNDIPFTSIADFNIVAGQGSEFAPFCRIPGGSNISIYDNSARDAQAISNALFITDTWFPPTNTQNSTIKRINLASQRPFPTMTAKNFVDIDDNNKLQEILRKNIGGVGLTCLYDYLDRDRSPISLALPTVETQPMICSVSTDFADGYTWKADQSGGKNVTVEFKDAKYGDCTLVRKVTPHRLTIPAMEINVSGTAAFPFKRISNQTNRKGSWKIEALAALFFAENDLKARLKEKTIIHPKKDWWNSPPDVKAADGVIWSKGQAQLAFTDDISRTDDALKSYDIPIRLPKKTLSLYYEISDTLTKKATKDEPEHVVEEVSFLTTDQTKDDGDGALTVYTKDGELAKLWEDFYVTGYNPKILVDEGELQASHGKASQHVVEFNNGTTFRPYIAVWVRVTDSTLDTSDKTVDLVPASYLDDETLRGISYADFKSDVVKMTGSGAPLLDFKLNRTFSYSQGGEGGSGGFNDLMSETAVAIEDWKSLYAPDPRFNYAPEDWVGTTDADASVSNWKSQADRYLGNDGRDPDIFMFTSDQEYLQSIGELAFIPNVQDMTGRADFFEGDFMNSARYHGNNNFLNRTDFANSDCFWRTYTPMWRNEKYIDPIYSLSDGSTVYEIVSGTGDFRVNPYSPDIRVLMAALKDTPYDWSVASTNEVTNKTLSDSASNSKNWAFCEKSSKARLYDDELADIAAQLRDKFEDEAKRGSAARWEDAFSAIDWYNGKKNDDQRTIFGISDDFEETLHSVDRKFLYGFWRECFQNRQQLFLVFMRAEPLTVGGSGSHALGSSQLGARGVALVWRDPLPPTPKNGTRLPRSSMGTIKNWEQNAPHRTRVLFYHQFD